MHIKWLIITLAIAIGLSGSGSASAQTATPTPIGGGTGQIAFNWWDLDGVQIYMMNADGTNRRQITKGNGGYIGPSWSPDGKQIAFTSHRDGDPKDRNKSRRFEIYVMNADGTNQRRLTNNPRLVSFAQVWSPDGVHIAFIAGLYSNADNRHIYIMDSDGKNVHRLTRNSGYESSPSWSPDGKSLMFSLSRAGNTQIYQINLDGKNQRQITKGEGHYSFPALSPDGKYIAYLYYLKKGNKYRMEVYVANSDATDPQLVTTVRTNAIHFSWSPDSKHLTFSPWEPEGESISRWDLTGNPGKITDTGFYPAWQPAVK